MLTEKAAESCPLIFFIILHSVDSKNYFFALENVMFNASDDQTVCYCYCCHCS